MDGMYTPPVENSVSTEPAAKSYLTVSIAGFVLGIVSLATFNRLFSGIVAIVLYITNKDKVEDPEHKKLLKIGFICGIVGTIIQAMYFVGIFIYILFLVGVISTSM